MHDAETGAFKLDAKSKPSLRATSAAVRSLAKLETAVPDKAKTAKFVMKCFDKASGGFAEPEGKPDVTITSIGIMAACELGIDRDDFKPAMTYLEKNAKTFEDVRIGAAAVEVWGVKKCPFDLEPWFRIAKADDAFSPENIFQMGLARAVGSSVAFALRLGQTEPDDQREILLNYSQRNPKVGLGRKVLKRNPILKRHIAS